MSLRGKLVVLGVCTLVVCWLAGVALVMAVYG
jgi:hypothetical protein